jgi:hypothetical protein
MLLTLKILGGVVAFAIGLWLGRPGHYRRSPGEIEALLDKADRQSPNIDRHLAPPSVRQGKGTAKLRSRGASFRLRSPDEEA